MKLRYTAAALAGIALVAAAPAAMADHNKYNPNACDTSDHRGGHDAPAGPADVVVPLANGYEVWAPGGHYVVRGPDGYVEVVGGQGFNVNGNQGGYVQGGAAGATFHANVFAGQSAPNASGFACVGTDTTGKVQTPGTQP